MASIVDTQNRTTGSLKASARPHLDVIVESKDEDTALAEINEKATSGNGNILVNSQKALPKTNHTTVRETSMLESSASTNKAAATSVSNIDASFDTFVEQQLKAPSSISAASADKFDRGAGSVNRTSSDHEVPQEPSKPDDLIDLTIPVTPPLRDTKKEVNNAANDSAAFLAAANTAYSTFNANRYAPRSNVKVTEEHGNSEEASTDEDISSDSENSETSLYQRESPDPDSILHPDSLITRAAEAAARGARRAEANLRIHILQSLSAQERAQREYRRSLFVGVSDKFYKAFNPSQDEDVERYVMRPGGLGSWFELPMRWKPACYHGFHGYYLLSESRKPGGPRNKTFRLPITTT